MRPSFEMRFLEPREAHSIVPAWRDLFRDAAEANPFYGPDFLLPLSAMDGSLAKARLLVVSEGDALLGLCPTLRRRFGLPGFGASLATLSHPFTFNGLPLLRAGHELPAWLAILDALEAGYRRGVLAIEPSPLDGPVAEALVEALRASGRASLVQQPAERAGIIATGSPEAHLARIKARTLSKLKRSECALAKLGKLEFRFATSGEELREAVEAFIALEARSWKGRQGSSFASDPAATAFARRALASGGDAPGVRAELFVLGDRPIGVFLYLVSPGYSAAFKIAYDEEFARQAPGVLTMLHSLRALLAEPWTRRLDSGAEPEHAVGAIWRDRFPCGSMLVALSSRQAQSELVLRARAQALAMSLRDKTRDAYYALTRRKRTQARKEKDD